MNILTPASVRFSSPRALLTAMVVAALALALRATDAPPRLIEQKGYQAARLHPREPELSIQFPGAATTKGIPEGAAVVSVAINAKGEATDFLITSCTDMAFGLALLDQAKPLRFEAGQFNGVAVPGRYDVSYRFINRSGSFALTAVDAGRLRSKTGADSALGYDAVAEKDLDQPLEILEAALPKIPASFAAPADKPVKVFVSFYIDEQGKVRLPNVESADAPELIPGAVKATGMWVFKPATAKGKPALVYTARWVRFLPRNPPAEAPAPAK